MLGKHLAAAAQFKPTILSCTLWPDRPLQKQRQSMCPLPPCGAVHEEGSRRQARHGRRAHDIDWRHIAAQPTPVAGRVRGG